MTPEERARQQIDARLEQSGWVLQDLRNKLAHQPSRFNAEDNVIELIDQRTGKVEKFTYDKFTEIRGQLLEVRGALRTLGAEGA